MIGNRTQGQIAQMAQMDTHSELEYKQMCCSGVIKYFVEELLFGNLVKGCIYKIDQHKTFV